MSFLNGLGGGLGGMLSGGLGGAITPLSGLGQIGGPLSGIGLLKSLFGGGGGGGGGDGESAAPAAAEAPKANAAAMGLGKLIGVDPGKISSIADSVGKGMNMIAQGGGAAGGYAAPELPQARPVNHLQLLDDNVLRALLQRFGGGIR